MNRHKARFTILMVFLLLLATALSSAEATKRVKALKPEHSNITLNVGETYTPRITITPEDAYNLDYIMTSSDESVVSVDEKNLTAVSAGKAVITVAPADGGKAKTKINVYVPTIAGPTQTEYTITSPGNLRIPLSYYGNDYASNVQIKIKNNKIISVQPVLNGTSLILDVAPMKVGETTITISDKKDSKASQKYTVNVIANAIPNARKITITKAKQTKWGIDINLFNGSDDPITELVFAVLLYDESGQLLQPKDKSASKWKDFSAKVELIDINYFERVKAGKKGELTLFLDSVINNTKFSRIDLAVVGYKPDVLIDFTAVPPVIIPESQWQWYSTSVKGYLHTPEASYNYTPPELENSTDKGIHSVLGYDVFFGELSCSYLTMEYAKLYGFHHTGALVYKVNGNWDKLYDVQVGDLVWGVDEIEYVTEPLMSHLFYEKYHGDRDHPKNIVIHLERDGVDHDITVNYRDYYDESNGKAFYYKNNQ